MNERGLREELEESVRIMRATSVALSALRPSMTLKSAEEWERLEQLHNELAVQVGVAEGVLRSARR